jgi:serine kinase of HPr protein (carbohydrate metabolism regulator)
MSDLRVLVMQASAVAIDGRALIIEGPPGSGKSSLTLALIDRGAQFIGDDGITLVREGSAIIAAPPPNIAGLLEIRGIGLVDLPVSLPAPVALILALGVRAERLPDNVAARDVLGVPVPVLPFEPGPIAPAVRAEWAFKVHGQLGPGAQD